MAIAIYRKYRPATFENLLGQELVAQILKEAAKQDKLSHAYLFAGPRGTGKTTSARLIAKVANCETRANDQKFKVQGEPCNTCTTCKEIDEGRYLDVLEIDAASNRGIDEIRNLKENVRVSPTHARYKVFIIDEAHQLTKDAANALLKTLEEPPPYVILILATTEPEKLPATIISRTQQFYFKHVSLKQIAGKLKTIANAEHIAIAEEALELIASSAEGSFRDAESLLDQLITFGNDTTITLEEVEKMIGKIGFNALAQFAEALLKKDVKQVLALVSDIHNKGYNIVQFTKDVIQYLRRAAVLRYNPEMKTLFEKELMTAHLEKLLSHAVLFADIHLELIKTLITVYSNMRYSQFPIIPLEVAIIESLKKETNRL